MTTLRLIPPSGIKLKDSLIILGDVRHALTHLPSNAVQCVISSPPYWGLRDYGITGQIGLEPSLDAFLQSLTAVFSEVHRVLKSDGVFWLNIGDGYTSGNRGWRAPDKKNPNRAMSIRPQNPPGLKDKELIGIPWRLAFALQNAGWFLRTDIIWHKPNAMPESVKDRPTRAHEFLFMFTKSEKYFYNAEAIREPAENGATRNRRTVWPIPTTNSGSSHIATFPENLVEPCLLATTQKGDFVLDPFFGSGTVGRVASRLGRRYVGIELNPDYVTEAEKSLQISSKIPRAASFSSLTSNEPAHQLAFLESPDSTGLLPPDHSTSLPATGTLQNPFPDPAPANKRRTR